MAAPEQAEALERASPKPKPQARRDSGAEDETGQAVPKTSNRRQAEKQTSDPSETSPAGEADARSAPQTPSDLLTPEELAALLENER